MVMAIESTLEQNPEFSYHYYNGTERREFIKQHMSPTILACYDKLIPGAYKADLFRYSVVFTHGGCYTDIGFVFLRPLREALLPDDNFVSSADGLPPNVEINSAFFCAVKGHHILNITIHKLANQVGKSNYGDDMLDISGPWMLRKGFQAYHNNESMVLQ
jgi:mannosyltransferase OCH1-like enzyme